MIPYYLSTPYTICGLPATLRPRSARGTDFRARCRDSDWGCLATVVVRMVVVVVVVVVRRLRGLHRFCSRHARTCR